MPVHDKDYRENFARSLFLTGKTTQEPGLGRSRWMKAPRFASLCQRERPTPDALLALGAKPEVKDGSLEPLAEKPSSPSLDGSANEDAEQKHEDQGQGFLGWKPCAEEGNGRTTPPTEQEQEGEESGRVNAYRAGRIYPRPLNAIRLRPVHADGHSFGGAEDHLLADLLLAQVHVIAHLEGLGVAIRE